MPPPGKFPPRPAVTGEPLTKTIVKKLVTGNRVDSFFRTLIGTVGAFLIGNGAVELAGEGAAGIDTWIELIGGGVGIGLYAILKWLDGTRIGGFIGAVVGPKVPDAAHSIGRWILVTINGLYAGSGFPGLDGDVAGWVSVALLWGVERFWSTSSRKE